MTPAQKAANRRVIDAAKRIEQAAQYGIDSSGAHEAYTQARNELSEARGRGQGAVAA